MARNSLSGKLKANCILGTNNGCDPNSLNCSIWVCNAFKCKIQSSRETDLPYKIKENFHLQLTADGQALGKPSYRNTLLEFCLRFWGRREEHRAKKMKSVFFSFLLFFLSSLTATFLLYQYLSLAGDSITQLIRKASLPLLFNLKCAT